MACDVAVSGLYRCAGGGGDVTTLSDRYSEEAYLAAIARRNITWCRWREADELLIEATLADRGRGLADLRPYVQWLNSTQNDYEHAARDLIKARVFWRAGFAQAA